MPYDLELERAIKKIRETNAKTVCIQLPSGLKPKATEIASALERETSAKVVIWAGSCFGACDIPQVEADLLIQWGHSERFK
ncbi:MAG: diphthamide synthesis protein [Candidatus Woesearchaeota archaeon]